MPKDSFPLSPLYYCSYEPGKSSALVVLRLTVSPTARACYIRPDVRDFFVGWISRVFRRAGGGNRTHTGLAVHRILRTMRVFSFTSNSLINQGVQRWGNLGFVPFDHHLTDFPVQPSFCQALCRQFHSFDAQFVRRVHPFPKVGSHFENLAWARITINLARVHIDDFHLSFPPALARKPCSIFT